jgi:hypothetical protein
MTMRQLLRRVSPCSCTGYYFSLNFYLLLQSEFLQNLSQSVFLSSYYDLTTIFLSLYFSKSKNPFQ